MPCEVKAVRLAGHGKREGESVMIHHIVTHVVEFSIEACVRTENCTSWENVDINLVNIFGNRGGETTTLDIKKTQKISNLVVDFLSEGKPEQNGKISTQTASLD